MMWWAIWCAAVVGAAAAPAPDALAPLSSLDLPQIDSLTSEDESLGYAVPSGGRLAPNSPWLYLLADMPRDSQVSGRRARRGFSVNPAVEVLQRGAYTHYMDRLAQNNREFLNCVGKRDPWSGPDCTLKHVVKEWRGRSKRRMTSLSIDLPMAVLRQKLSLEKARKQQALRAAENRNYLNDIGKRGFLQWEAPLESQMYN